MVVRLAAPCAHRTPREALGREYSEFMAAHPTTELDIVDDRDPQTYVDNLQS